MTIPEINAHFESAITVFKGDILEVEETEIEQLIELSFLIYYTGIPEVIATRGNENNPENLRSEAGQEIVQILGNRVTAKKETTDWIAKQSFKFSMLLMDKFSVKDGKLQLRAENFPDKWSESDRENFATITTVVNNLYIKILKGTTSPDTEKEGLRREIISSLDWRELLSINLVSNSNVLEEFYRNRYRKSRMN